MPEGGSRHCVGDGRNTEAPGKLLSSLVETSCKLRRI